MKTVFRDIVIWVTSILPLGSCSHQPTSERISGYEIPATNASETAVTAEAYFDWPVNRARLTRGFKTNRRRPHLGIDLAAEKGSPILSAQKGIVIYAGRDFKGFGKMVLIESGRGWATIYAHLDKILVGEGQKVLQGEIIATMGRTGRATGTHLHFEIRKDKGPVDPLLYLPKGQSVAKMLSSN